MTPARLLIAVAVVLAVGTASANEAAFASTPTTAQDVSRTLDLRPPSIYDIFTEEDIARILSATFDRNIEGVEVEGERVIERAATPRVWQGLGAPFWALANPAQAWRILAPWPPDRARTFAYEPPRATDTFLESAALTPP